MKKWQMDYPDLCSHTVKGSREMNKRENAVQRNDSLGI